MDQFNTHASITYDRNIMKDMLEILEPFEQATDIGLREKTFIASFVVVVVVVVNPTISCAWSRS